jgi:hypothetical protein
MQDKSPLPKHDLLRHKSLNHKEHAAMKSFGKVEDLLTYTLQKDLRLFGFNTYSGPGDFSSFKCQNEDKSDCIYFDLSRLKEDKLNGQV